MLPRAPGQAPIRTCAPVTLVQHSNLSTIANAVAGRLRLFRPSCGPMLAVLLALLVLFAPGVLAGPHAGGTLVLHADPGVQYSVGEAYCEVELTACSLAVVEVPADPNTTTVFNVLAAFPEAAQVDLRGVQFGISYDAQRLVLVAHGSCADFVLPTPGWPASDGGVGMTWDEAQTDRLVDLYWFAGYAYSSSEPTLFELTPHPTQGGAFADGSITAVVDTIAAYGALGFGMPGLLACPEVEEDGGGEGDGGGPEDGIPSADGDVWVQPSGIVIADGVWSFLVKTRALHAVSGMGLRIGSTDYSPTLVVETTDSTAVVTFRHEAATSELSAHLRFPGGELAELRVLDGPGHKHERWRKGSISVVSRYGAIRYPPHARERSLDELEGTDESLLVLFRQIGCQSVTKSLYDQTEDPSPEDSLISVRQGVPVKSRALDRSYRILINPEFSERALAFFIGDHPAIEHASVSYMGTQYSYTPPNDWYEYQWYCRHQMDHEEGWYGTGVNWAWGGGCRGYETTIAVIDREYPVSTRINYGFGDTPTGGATDDHGLRMALMALSVEASGANSMSVGIAFDGSLNPVYVPYSWITEDLAAAFRRARNYYSDVISISIAVETGAEDLPLLREEVEACFDAGIPIVATRGPSDSTYSYPASWDQSHFDHKLVLSCNTCKKNGSPYNINADMYAPGESIVHPLYGYRYDNDTGSYCAPQIAAGIAVSWVFQDGAADAYRQVLESAYNTQYPVLNISTLTGYTGILDVTEVHTEGDWYTVWVKWRVTDSENIQTFEVYESAACWGPFEALVSFPVGDPVYTADGEYYEVPVYTPYDRNYYFKVVATYGGISAAYQTEGRPTVADPVDQGPAPGNVMLQASWSEMELSWDRWWYPDNEATEYWVLRRWGYPLGDGCPYTWGEHLRGVVPDAHGTCSNPLTALRACWYDQGPIPDVTYHYRVASVRRGYNNRVMWVSDLSEEESGSGWEPGSIEDAAEPAARLEASVSPTPVLRGSTTRLEASGIRGDDGTVALCDIQGRKVLQRRMGSQLRDGRFTMDLEGKDVLRSAGVYFCRVDDDSGQRVERKIVVIR